MSKRRDKNIEKTPNPNKEPTEHKIKNRKYSDSKKEKTVKAKQNLKINQKI